MTETGAPETVTVWRAFRGIYGFNLGVEQPICGDQAARAVVHCSLCAITQRFFLRFTDKARIRIGYRYQHACARPPRQALGR
jgi:hypothetical protein